MTTYLQLTICCHLGLCYFVMLILAVLFASFLTRLGLTVELVLAFDRAGIHSHSVVGRIWRVIIRSSLDAFFASVPNAVFLALFI